MQEDINNSKIEEQIKKEVREKSFRVSLTDTNIRRINLIKTLINDEVELLNDKEAVSYIINKAIEKYYKSDEIQKRIQEL